MAATLPTKFEMQFLEWKTSYFYYFFTDISSYGPNKQQASIGPDKDWSSKRLQCIILSNDSLFYLYINASRGLDQINWLQTITQKTLVMQISVPYRIKNFK